VSLFLGDLLNLGDVLTEFITAFLSRLATLLRCLIDILLGLLAKEQIRLVNGLLALHSGLVAFLLGSWGNGPAPHHKDIPTLFFSAL
jgi:hypothetical protein